jgi:hypothetical protein
MRVVKNSDSGLSWTFMTCASAADGRRHVVLKPDNGTPVCVEYTEFIKDYSMEGEAARVAASDVVKETLNSIRQTSTLRFAALAVFVAAFGALAAGLLNTAHVTTPPAPGSLVLPPPFDWFHWIAGAGLILATIGSVFEFVLSRNLNCWWQALKERDTKGEWSIIFAHRNGFALWIARIALFLPYPSMFAFWIYLLTKDIAVATVPPAVLFVAVIVLWFFARPKK